MYYVPMIVRTENQKILLQTRDENIEIEHLLSVFRSLVEPLIRLQEVRQNDDVSFFFDFKQLVNI
jgi:hypothetical protein